MTITPKENMALWERVKQPPKEALKEIKGGRLKGMTDISPMWRYQILTELYGPCGGNWGYKIVKTWIDSCGDEVVASAEILLRIDGIGEVPGIGGSKLSTKESKGVYVCDEAYKMAVTDALSVACKMLGVGANIYMGKGDGSKYGNNAPQSTPQQPGKPSPSKPNATQGPDGKDGKLIADGNVMLKAMAQGDENAMIALVNKHSGFDGKNGRVQKDRLEELKDKWLFRTFKNIEGEYDLWKDTQDNVGSDDMSIPNDEPIFDENGVEVPFK